jgi:cysteine desulfurase
MIKDKKENDPDLILLYHHLWVHNETGFVSPLEELRELSQINDLYIHVDAVQAPGKISHWPILNFGDIWTFSAHKFGALKGIGFSILKKHLPFYPFISGGGQQQNKRSGTENPMGVKSIALALADLQKISVEKNHIKKTEFEQFLALQLINLGGVLSSPHTNSNTIYFYFYSLSSDVAVALFDLHGIELSSGSACSSGAARPSTVMTLSGLSAWSKNGLRLSFGFDYSETEWDAIRIKFSEVFDKIRGSVLVDSK